MSYKNEEVIKEFVNYGLDETIKSKHLYFEQDVLFSYGSHFPLCIRLKDCQLINKDGYSSTTSRHKGALIRAVVGNYSYDLKTLELSLKNKEREDIKLLTTQELKDFLLENLSEKGLRFITFGELNKLRILKQL